jgi:hypothetical protein
MMHFVTDPDMRAVRTATKKRSQITEWNVVGTTKVSVIFCFGCSFSSAGLQVLPFEHYEYDH